MEIQQNSHQGDCQFFKIKSIPSSAKKIEPKFIAESERSGSRHALMGNYEMYEYEGGFVIDVKEDCILNHCLKAELDAINNDLTNNVILPKKDHRHGILKKGIYLAGIQQRFNPMEGYLQNVKD